MNDHESSKYRLDDFWVLLKDLVVTSLRSIVGTDDHQHLLVLLDRSTLNVEASVSVTESIDLLDCELPFELIKPNYLVQVLIESNPVSIVRSVINLKSSFNHLLNLVRLSTVMRTSEPKVTSLLLEIDSSKVEEKNRLLINCFCKGDSLLNSVLLILQHFVDLIVPLNLREILKE